MIVPDPEAPGGERAKVLDFGIAKVLASAQGHGGDAIEQSSQTRTGMMVGTPLYMAPEQCRGSGIIGDRADVYSLGVMLYRLLCGRPPFIGDGSGAVMAMHIYEPPPPLRQFEPAIPEDLAALVHQLLAKDPAQRPAMAAVAEQLEQLKALHSTGVISTTDIGLITSQPYLGQPRTPTPVANSLAGPNPLLTTLAQSAAQMGPPPRRRAPLIAVASIAGGVMIVGALVAGLVLRKPEREHRPAVTSGPVRPVKWSISSEPPGATVLRAVDQTEVGRTPWNTSQPAANGQLILILRHAGYADRVVTSDQSANAFVQETLQPLASSVVAAPPADPAQPAPPLKRGKKGGKKGTVAADGTSQAPPDKTPATPTTPTPTTPKPKDETSNGRIQVVD
jgi:serine/threonine-protein kinase